MNLQTAQELLNANGFPCGPADGVYGAKTRAGLMHFQAASVFAWETGGTLDEPTINALNQLPNLTHHFTSMEMDSRGRECYIRKELLHALEALRTHLGRPIPVASGYRTLAHNASLPNSATNSMHLYGFAADLFSVAVHASLSEVRSMGLFSGIGWVKSTGYVRHVDVRHMSGRHTATPWKPDIWTYTR